jgi:hypothetical protein
MTFFTPDLEFGDCVPEAGLGAEQVSREAQLQAAEALQTDVSLR